MTAHTTPSPAGASSALFTDFYALTMAQGYWKQNLNRRAAFEMFFRRNPFGGGFSVFAGLGTLLEQIAGFTFSIEDIEYLRSLGLFEAPFLNYLQDFRFAGSLWSMDEGQVVFPQEPLLRIEGGLIECQLLEGLVLNTINFQSLIATKTARVWLASGKGTVMEFGLRRAQGRDGAMSASRAAYIGGAAGTSNVLAGKEFNIPVMGTMAHSWIMAHPSEEAAFRAYAALYPRNPVFLIDTYDTLQRGIRSAVTVGKELAAAGKNFGVRLDSGDIHYLSVEVRRILDAAGLRQATIAVSNDLDESIIQTLTSAGAPVNVWGVGTRMVTGGNDAAFTGVYKLTASETAPGRFEPAMKFSDNPDKNTTPGIKRVWRVRDAGGMAAADVMGLAPEDQLIPGERRAFWHPQADYRHFYHVIEGGAEELLHLRIDRGKCAAPAPSLEEIRGKLRAELETFDPSYQRFLNPHVYKVSLTERLRALKLDLIKTHLGEA
ncbi:MAG: nicotinate phosphoribosyltransferase [Treponema sp.]|nr:nicotinate phosphoribosyltransferase [Treponema sp.]